MPPTLYLIDGHALAYRMYFALTAVGGSQRWQTSKGEPTAGIYGFARELMRIIEQEKPDYIAVAFDTGKTFRDQIFPEYKGTRDKMPDDLSPQITRIRELVDAFNIPRLELEGFEADDVLGSIAHIANEQGLGVKIITGDRDLLQLVNERTMVYLAGDDNNYAHIDEVENRWRTKLEQNKDKAYMSYDLAKIKTDINIHLDLEHARADDLDFDSIEALFTELEFRSLIKTLGKLSGKESSATEPAVSYPKAGQQLSMFVN